MMKSSVLMAFMLCCAAATSSAYIRIKNRQDADKLRTLQEDEITRPTVYPTYFPTTSWPSYAPTTLSPTTPAVPGDLFLLSGQSNMIGHTTSSESLTKDDSYWLRLKSIIEAGDNSSSMEDDLFAAMTLPIIKAEGSSLNDLLAAMVPYKYNGGSAVAERLTSALMGLYELGLLSDLDKPLEFGRCSFVIPYDDGRMQSMSKGSVPIQWNAGCGQIFGSELMFATTLERSMGYNATNFEMVKIAHGGTQLYDNWFPSQGTYWNELNNTISKRRGQGSSWKAFVWHQGENDALTINESDDTSRTYFGNLTALVKRVRMEMFNASEDGTWQCKEEIPTIIVQIGYWPNDDGGDRVRDAQARFCREDSRAVLVKTDDLSHFFHFDAASFLVIGNRIAEAYQEALETNLTCPDIRPEETSKGNLV